MGYLFIYFLSLIGNRIFFNARYLLKRKKNLKPIFINKLSTGTSNTINIPLTQLNALESKQQLSSTILLSRVK